MKHFLDTSVARHLLIGSTSYKKYLLDTLDNEHLYISNFVLMELNRSYLCSVIEFYFVLDMPHIQTIGDAFSFWSDKFAKSKLKAIVQMVGELFRNNQLSFDTPSDKDKALIKLSSYIIRAALLFRNRFKNIGINSTRCKRAEVDLAFKNDKETIRKFHEDFNDIVTCRNECNIADYLSKKYIDDIRVYIKNSEQIQARSTSDNKGFVKIAVTLKKILEDVSQSTCKDCEKIGDAIIALEMPKLMRLETIDYSFSHLCAPIGKKYFRHLSQTSVLHTTQEKEN